MTQLHKQGKYHGRDKDTLAFDIAKFVGSNFK